LGIFPQNTVGVLFLVSCKRVHAFDEFQGKGEVNILTFGSGYVTKIIFLGILGVVGYLIGFSVSGSPNVSVVGALWGIVIGIVILVVEFLIQKISARAMLGAILGGIFGISLSSLLMRSFAFTTFQQSSVAFYVYSSVVFVCGFVGIMVGVKRIQHLDMRSIRQFFSERPATKNYKILDTSVIIDGRIADISETGFLEGILIIPQFILKELQHIADSSDPIKRNRGRRGLDILHKIQKRVDIQVEIHDRDFPKIKEIDGKLVELGKLLQAKLITNDFNLNKVAELQGVSVLNVNELANALKPVVLPGEVIEVQVLKEGKEYGQGIAYLDDGTMIVIDHAKKLIGKTVNIAVTSVLQTTAGRMIFGQLATKEA
jgi:uncharacterized protein YacL